MAGKAGWILGCGGVMPRRAVTLMYCLRGVLYE